MGAQESKLSFRRGIFRLHEERHIPVVDPYWQNYWTLPESAEDIFTLFSASDIRKCRDEAPENIRTLVVAVSAHLISIFHNPQFPRDERLLSQMLNCLRILTRLIPFLFEDKAFESAANTILWTPITRQDTDITYEGQQKSIGAPSQADLDAKNHWLSAVHAQDLPPLAEELIQVLIDLLFFCGFTIPSSYGKERVVYGIWETGVGCSLPMGTTKQFESNKIETLRCILALISRGMYVPASKLMRSRATACLLILADEIRDNRHITHLVLTIPKNVVLALLCSLLNTTMKFNPTTWRTIPYSSTFLSDSRQLLVSYSLQFLLVVLCYPLPERGTDVYPRQSADGEAISGNRFKHFFKKLHRANDFNFMVEGMSRVLHQPLSASSTYLPGSQKPVRFYPEMLLLFWESLQQNRRFRSFLIETDRALDFLVVLLFYALEHKTNPAQIGLVRMCVFILQPLSAEAKFAKALNKTFEGQASLPASMRIPSFSGSYVDFLIISIYGLIATSKGQLVSLYAALFMILSNIAPYAKNLSVVASTKLIQLFSSISQPSFLFANDSNFRLLQYFLEVLNGVIEHNFSDNSHLIYAILRSHKRFEHLQELTLSVGIATIRKLKEAKAERKQQQESARLVKEKDIEQEQDQSSGTVGTDSENPFSIGDLDSSDTEADGKSSGKTSNNGGTGSSAYESRAVSPTKTGSQTPSRSRKSSLSSDMDYPPPSPRVMSEKARGKLPEGAVLHRQNSSSSIRSTHSTASINDQHAGNDEDFSPSGEWFEGWYPDLDLAPIVAVLDQLAAEVTKLSQESPDPRPIIKYLKRARIEGIVARAPNPRSFVWSEQAKVWFESLLFGYIYMSETQIGNGAVGVWTGTNVKLFRIQSDPEAEDPNSIFRIGHIAVDAVTNQLNQTFTRVTIATATAPGAAEPGEQTVSAP